MLTGRTELSKEPRGRLRRTRARRETGGEEPGRSVCLHSTGAERKDPEWSGRGKVKGVRPSLKQGTHSLPSPHLWISRVLCQEAEGESQQEKLGCSPGALPGEGKAITKGYKDDTALWFQKTGLQQWQTASHKYLLVTRMDQYCSVLGQNSDRSPAVTNLKHTQKKI